MALRKKFHNELVELKGNIRVFCRVRPIIREDGKGKMAENVVSFDSEDDGLVYLKHKDNPKKFEMDKVFMPESTQTEVCLFCLALILQGTVSFRDLSCFLNVGLELFLKGLSI